jgi:DNA-binding transcriptional MerR regulator
VYGEGAARRLAFIRHARDLGFGLTAVRSLLALQDNLEVPCAEASRIASDQLAAVEAHIGRLQTLRVELRRMVGACTNGRAANCRVIEALAQHGKGFSSDHGPTR